MFCYEKGAVMQEKQRKLLGLYRNLKVTGSDIRRE